MPYYFGADRIARLASLNIEQFLGLGVSIFEEVIAGEWLGETTTRAGKCRMSVGIASLGVADAVKGHADLAIQPVSELIHVGGADYLGPVPNVVQFVSVFSAAIVSGSKQVETSKRLIAFLGSTKTDAAIKDSGMERLTKSR